MEAVYLAKQAQFEVAVIDKNPKVPARSLVETFYNFNLLSEEERSKSLLKEFDLVIPATENYNTLRWLHQLSLKYDIPVALDLQAYNISCSKIRSNQLLAHRVSLPEAWPECGFPVIVKPSGLSGSSGVRKVFNSKELTQVLATMGKDVVIQKYLSGPSYSLEVVGHKGKCAALQVTKLEMDADYDCKRVLAGPQVGSDIIGDFHQMGDEIASAINLSGIMDIEVIQTERGLELLEIDARLPSQTPSAVFHSSGINMVELLLDYWLNGRLPDFSQTSNLSKAVIYEHFNLKRGLLEGSGEHILRDGSGLKIMKDQFGADVLISNMEMYPRDWVATAIFVANTEKLVWEKRNKSIANLCSNFNVRSYVDPNPFNQRGERDDTIVL